MVIVLIVIHLVQRGYLKHILCIAIIPELFLLHNLTTFETLNVFTKRKFL
jgi:hypothetical protein